MKQPFARLYLHLPFCRRKCGYCAFYSVDRHTSDMRQAYLQELNNELASFRGQCRPLRSIFIGGGTPSVLTPDELEELLRLLHMHVHMRGDCEFTVECNPESLTHEKLQVLCDGGVNRLSIGIQSFNPVHRQTLLRRGSPAAYQNILRRVRESGFTNVNVDLIYGIPGQTVADWMMDVSMALDYGVTHLSTYGLTLEEGTALATKPCVRVEDAVQVDMWEAAGRLAAARGLRRYEVSNLAIPGKECGHNLAIWYGATYLGCGPAASSFDGAVRWTNPADLDVWLRGAAPMYDELAPNLRAAELLAFGLRTTMGWDLAVFQEQTGFDAMTLRGDAIESLAADGLLQVDGSSLCPTERGLLFADTIAVRLLQ